MGPARGTVAWGLRPVSGMDSARLVEIREARERAGSVREVARRTGIPVSTVQAMTREARGLDTARSWWRLLLALGLDPDDVLGAGDDGAVSKSDAKSDSVA